MQFSILILVLLGAMALAFHFGRRRSLGTVGGAGGIRNLHSLPAYYGFYTALWAGLPALLVVGLWVSFEGSLINSMVIESLPAEMRNLPPAQLGLLINDIQNLANGNIVSGEITAAMQGAADHMNELRTVGKVAMAAVALSVALGAGSLAWLAVAPKMRARNRVEWIINSLLIASSLIAILTTVGIVLSVVFESFRFFQKIPLTDFLFGLEWSPQTALRADQVGASGAFGSVPLFAGTLLISLIALLVAVPIGLMSAIYLSDYAGPRLRSYAKPVLEVLAGVPTVVYGFFAALTLAPAIRGAGEAAGLTVSSESALAAGLVMGIMIIPFVSSLSDDVINAVPQSLRDAAYALGATRSETIRQVILPAALPGIMGGILLAASRAIGETMIVVMAAGLSANLTANPLDSVTTVTVQIVTLLVGDQEFDSAKTLAAFALGLLLFLVTLGLNIVALHIVRKYREQYE
ncbi:MAG: phosphate ABC transporter permease subunit PstC [Gammaproteobacteria bacterium]|nr:phosphate ABC transporter permease subunit PstC [Gammaproteobacteria bacterium]